MMNQKIKRIFITTSILVATGFISVYILGVNSEPYQIAVQFLKANDELAQTLGPIKNYRLSFFGYSLRYSGPSGHAEFKIMVKGENSQGTVYVFMEKLVGEWKILKANLVKDHDAIMDLVDREELKT